MSTEPMNSTTTSTGPTGSGTNHLRWESLTPERAADWATLVNLLAVVDGTNEFYEPEDLAEELSATGFDPSTDTVAVWHGDVLIGYGQLHPADEPTAEGYARVVIGGGVHPEHRGRGIGTRIMDRLEPRARELAAARLPGNPVQLRVSGGLATDPVRPLLDRRGYRIVRYFTVMGRELPGEPLPEMPLPDQGLTIEPFRPELAEPLRQAHNDAFATHWGSTPKSVEQWADIVTARSFRPTLSRVVADAGGEILAYVLANQWTDGEFYINMVGTRRHARGRGLARAALVASLRAAIDAGGYRRAELDVDSENPAGAGALYASVGFTELRTLAAYAKLEQA